MPHLAKQITDDGKDCFTLRLDGDLARGVFDTRAASQSRAELTLVTMAVTLRHLNTHGVRRTTV